jgi:GNAT superfamily N-acetyltransferase
MTFGLSDSTKAEIRAMWATRLNVPLTYLERVGRNYVERDDSTWVVIVELDDSQITIAPSFVTALLSRIPTDQLFDLAIITTTLVQFSPQPIGSALLLYPVMEARNPVTEKSSQIATIEQVDRLLARCLTSEADESGLRDMETRFEEVDLSGAPIAVAGYEVWSGTVAQLGVLVDPLQRGRGVGRRVANLAIDDARSRGLIPQWRVRVDNASSVSLAEQLGFTRLGRQVALEITPPESHS